MKLSACVLAVATFTVGVSARAQSRQSFDVPFDSALSQIALRVEASEEVVEADSVMPAKKPSLAGIGFVGALAWYPGAVAGAFAGAGSGAGTGSGHRWPMAIIVGGGASTGLVIGLLTASKLRCDPVRAVGRAVLGAEIGSVAGAALTGAFSFSLYRSSGTALAAAPVAIPLASALVAIAFVRGCQGTEPG